MGTCGEEGVICELGRERSWYTKAPMEEREEGMVV